jgi:hemolysin activation/secretion protein
VRGYRENTLVRDNAFLFSTETRIPIFPKILGGEFLQLAPFVDVGRSWLAKDTTPDPQTLASIGMGLRFSYGALAFPYIKNLSANIYWGQQLNHVTNPGNGLQDHGVHFQVVVQVF